MRLGDCSVQEDRERRGRRLQCPGGARRHGLLGESPLQSSAPVATSPMMSSRRSVSWPARSRGAISATSGARPIGCAARWRPRRVHWARPSGHQIQICDGACPMIQGTVVGEPDEGARGSPHGSTRGADRRSAWPPHLWRPVGLPLGTKRGARGRAGSTLRIRGNRSLELLDRAWPERAKRRKLRLRLRRLDRRLARVGLQIAYSGYRSHVVLPINDSASAPKSPCSSADEEARHFGSMRETG